jgi:molecular chaperone DnaJ
MVAKRDYYFVLGVERTVTDGDLKAAYRKLAVKYHPDHNQGNDGAEEQFKELTEAYAVLSDENKRRRYDQLGHSAFGNGEPMSGTDLSGIADMLEGFFEDVFGKKSDARLPKDLRYNLELSFEQAAAGGDQQISYERQEICERCRGTKSEPSTVAPECPACRGRGEVRYQRGFFSASRPCSACEGTGVRSDARCKSCNAKGSRGKQQTLTIRIPEGVEDGSVRTVRGAGEQTQAGAGDLHVHIKVLPHPFFTRDGADIHCEVPIQYPQATLGAQIDVPTLDGKVTMRVPPGTQSGKSFRLRGKGLPAFGGVGKGDQFVTLIIEVPQQVTEKQRALLEALASEMNTAIQLPRTHSFLDKLKHLFE